MDLEEKIELAAEWIIESDRFVAFTGAGISTHSGLPDYRGPDGVWTRRDKGLPPPKMKVSWDEVQPNEGHYALVELMEMEILDYVISQNVDGLHAKSGIPFDKLAELHGNQFFMKCIQCNKKMTFEEAGWDKSKHGLGYRTSPITKDQPECPYCGGRLISSIVNFGDPLPQDELYEAIEQSKKADVFFVIGSSLVVTPAADLPGAAQNNGAKLIILNQGETPYDNRADLRFFNDIKNVLNPIVEKIKEKIDQNQ
ncbi:MAG: putative NAD-dependent protein deacetylase [Promethearchaeota archaeon]|jgi:mono-ADP-ribosyltransferase sirtuin 6|nr:MAG: putative NAD-dependent protein deacetylase [Candidatus Lokiarchaeota archaeon]